MHRLKRLEDISKTPSAAVEAERKPGLSEGKKYLSTLPSELQLRIVHYLPRRSLATICQLDKHWRSVGTDEILRWLLPIPPCKTDEYEIRLGKGLLKRPISNFINTNNVDALQRLLDFRPEHPYFRPTTTPYLLAEPLTLRARMTKDEKEQFCLGNDLPFSSFAVDATFKFNDTSSMQLLINHGLADYCCLLHRAASDDFSPGLSENYFFARPLPGADSRGGHNSVLNWLLAYPPRHVIQAILIMRDEPFRHPRLYQLIDWSARTARYEYKPDYNMLTMACIRGHPASLQMINDLRLMVEILTDDTTGAIIPEARRPLSKALLIARGMASMWPGTRPLAAEYLQSVCTWENHQSSSSGDCSTNNNPPPPPAPPLILPQQDYMHRLIDLKTYDEMLGSKNWLELQQVEEMRCLLWLVSTEFLADEDAARQMRCFRTRLCELNEWPESTYTLLIAASAFRRWRCVEVVLFKLRKMWSDDVGFFRCPDSVLCRAIIDTVHGEPGCADGHIIRKLLRTCTVNPEDREDCGGVVSQKTPFRGSRFGWEPFRLAFVEQQQDREQRVTRSCMEMRDAVLDNLSISDQDALDFLASEPSKALYRASKRRLLKRLANKRERGRGAG